MMGQRTTPRQRAHHPARQLRLGSGKIIGRKRKEKKKRGDLHARSQGGEWMIGRLCMQVWHIIHEPHTPITTLT